MYPPDIIPTYKMEATVDPPRLFHYPSSSVPADIPYSTSLTEVALQVTDQFWSVICFFWITMFANLNAAKNFYWYQGLEIMEILTSS